MRLVIVTLVTACVISIGVVAVQASTEQDSASLAGAKFAYVDIQRVATESTHGQAANARVQELSEQKLGEIEAKNTELSGAVEALNQQLEELQSKLQQGQNVMSTEALLDIERDISRIQIDAQRTAQDSQAEMERLSQDAEGEVQALQQELQIEFQKKLLPAIEEVASDKGLTILFSATEGAIVWAIPDLDVTEELIVLMNQQSAETP